MVFVTVKLDVKVGLPEVTLNKHSANRGQPDCDKVTVCEAPLNKATVIEEAALVPWLMVTPVGVVTTEKSNDGGGGLETLIITLPTDESPSKSVALKVAL